LHANFVEAILDDRTFASIPHWALTAIEIIFSVLAGILFALLLSGGAKVVAIGAMVFATFVAQWIMLHEFGVFFDSLVPVVGLGLHSWGENLIESVKEWWQGRHEAA
jgi:hypothetical protein